MYLRCPGYLFGSLVGIATITNPHQVEICYLQNKVLVSEAYFCRGDSKALELSAE